MSTEIIECAFTCGCSVKEAYSPLTTVLAFAIVLLICVVGVQLILAMVDVAYDMQSSDISILPGEKNVFPFLGRKIRSVYSANYQWAKKKGKWYVIPIAVVFLMISLQVIPCIIVAILYGIYQACFKGSQQIL